MVPEGFTRLTEETVPEFTAALDKMIQAGGGVVHVRDGDRNMGNCRLSWSRQDYSGVPVVECRSIGGMVMPCTIRTADFTPGADNHGVAYFQICDDEIVICIDYGETLPKWYRRFRPPAPVTAPAPSS